MKRKKDFIFSRHVDNSQPDKTIIEYKLTRVLEREPKGKEKGQPPQENRNINS